MATGKKYYWLKLKRDFFKRHDIRIIESMPNGKDYVLFYLKLMAESIDHEGYLRFNEFIPYDENMLSVITNTNIDTVRSAMTVLRQLGLVDKLDDQSIYMTEVEKFIGCETDWALKKRAYAERKKVEKLLSSGEKVSTNEEIVSEPSPSFPIRDRVRDRVRDRDNIQGEKNEQKEGKPSPQPPSEKGERTPKKPKEVISLDAHDLSPDLKKAFLSFLEFRTKIKRPMTQIAADLAIKKLYSLGKSEADRIAILEQSIVQGWIGLFALKTGDQGQQKYPAKTPSNVGNFTQREYTDEQLNSFYEEVEP